MKVYVSGPMTGYEEFNYPAFHEAARQLREAGYEVVSPAEILPAQEGLTWVDYLRADIKGLCDCDAVATLPGWEKSKGATLEVHIARELAFPVYTVDQLLLAKGGGWYCEKHGSTALETPCACVLERAS